MAVIPTGNPAALIGYYLGIVSLIPFLGCITCIPALVCGIIGLIKVSKEPAASGKMHSIVAIALGLFGPLVGGFIMWVLAALTG